MFAFGPDAALGAPAASLEYPIKATFLYKFAPFVQWPPSAFDSATAPIQLCVLGSDAVTAALVQVGITETVANRTYLFRRLERATQDSGCHILYIAGTSPQSAQQAIEAVRGAPVMTVTDSAQTVQSSGIINFIIQENRVRFDIDDAAAAQNGLSISSRLLDLARSVRRRP
jgi:hypothetical protein